MSSPTRSNRATILIAIGRPEARLSPLAWLRKNLFRTPFDTILTLIVAYIALSLGVRLIHWIVNEAQWTVITTNFRVLMQGKYPLDQGWRLALCVFIGVGLAGLSWGIWGRMFRPTAIMGVAGIVLFLLLPLAQSAITQVDGFGGYLSGALFPLLEILRIPLISLVGFLGLGYAAGRALRAVNRRTASRLAAIAWLVAIPVIFLLVRGVTGESGALPVVSTNNWGGLLLTFMLAFVAIVACFPLGILLALGRVSGGIGSRRVASPSGWRGNPLKWPAALVAWWRNLGPYPIIKLFCVLYIELFRGVPLVTVFFTASVIVPLALGDTSVDSVVRAMVALTLFEAAYIAEIVRGGLQAIPPGQSEAARALGLNPIYITLFITLPQALRIAIPTLVGQFITLFKDTSLAVIVGVSELLLTGQSVLVQQEFIGRHREMYVFIALIYFVFSYGMSTAARQLERSGAGAMRKMG